MACDLCQTAPVSRRSNLFCSPNTPCIVRTVATTSTFYHQNIVLCPSALPWGPGWERCLLPVCWSQARSPGIQCPDGLRGAAEADQGQGNLSSTKKEKDRNLETLFLALLELACLPSGEGMKRYSKSSHLEVWLNEGGERIAVDGGWEGKVVFDLDFWRQCLSYLVGLCSVLICKRKRSCLERLGRQPAHTRLTVQHTSNLAWAPGPVLCSRAPSPALLP